ncbi:MAG: hypothetical protein GTO53_03985 [Planctomycetales bacterium]|nr:hypothetical protein [Planctomycetales bacterium]NIM08320.1 hypothetical protein [Planctomycetales bacterium]NIN07794.1 hypothetical protein [Planctomycetales bacterium]NIN76925.1 hypothetical protein [Planctomycetales bacterium]NIO34113.1 hypothetical protein [Planctomycetales bacterium]
MSSLRFSHWQLPLEQLLVWIVFLAHAGWLVPDVNEPNYLAKAKYYWDPQWCGGDFFLQSGDAHAVFFWFFGWLTQVWSLPAVALLGRIVTCGCLAVAWQRLAMQVAPRRWLAVISAALFVCFNSRLHMAGEWAVGGVESKGFAYALVFAGLAALVRARWNLAWILLGAATAIHVLVGGWALIAAGFAWCWLRDDPQRPRLIDMLKAMALAGLLALVGIWPAVQLSTGVDPQIVAEARWIQVFHRLPHHLNPQHFLLEKGWLNVPFGLRFLALSALWLLLVCRLPDPPNRRLAAVVLGGLAIAGVGLAISLLGQHDPHTTAPWLRFYWFRLADVILPAGAALAVTGWITTWHDSRRRLSGLMWTAGLLLAAWHVGDRVTRHSTASIPLADRRTAQTDRQLADWRAVCDHIRRVTPPDAIFIVPRRAHTFKWYAHRGEVGTWKEMPQDAASIPPWWSRLEDLHLSRYGWRKSLTDAPPQRLLELASNYGADYLVTDATPLLPFTPIIRNDSFAVYRLFPPSPPDADGRTTF